MVESKQCVHVPKIDLKAMGLEVKDLAVYAYLRKHYNAITKEAYPSFQTLSRESGLSKPTIMKSINRLASAGYITINKVQKVNHYTFSEKNKFEIYSFDFLDDSNISIETKGILISIQQYMFRDEIEGMGVIHYSEFELADKLGIDVRTYRKYELSLMNENSKILQIVPSKTRKDSITGLACNDRIFNFEAYHNMIAAKFQDVDQNIDVLKAELHSTKTELNDTRIRLNLSEQRQTAIEKELKDLKRKMNMSDAEIVL